MSWALQALGLADDADERAIKRAYAARLKVTRPDDDPVGFQQLHETYQTALAWRRQQAAQALDAAAEADHEGDGRGRDGDWGHDAGLEVETARLPAALAIPPPQAPAPARDADRAAARRPLPAVPPEPIGHQAPTSHAQVHLDAPAIDIGQLQLRVLQQARVLEPEPLERWLLAQPELWSLEHKPRVGSALQWRILEQPPALSSYNYDVLAKFFDWDHALDAPDPFLVQQARQQMHRHWLLQPQGYGELSRELQRRGDANASVAAVRTMIGWLKPAPSEGAAFAAMLWPPRVRRVRRLLDLVGYAPTAGRPPAPLDRERAAGWYFASAKQAFNPVIALLGLARSGIVAAVILGLSLLLAMIDNNPAAGMSPVLRAGLYGAGAAIGGWIAWYGFTSLARWQARAESDRMLVRPAVQRFFIPAATLITAALLALGLEATARTLALVLLGLALWRWARRSGWTPQFRWGWVWGWLLIFGVKAAALAIGMLVMFPAFTLAATAIAWIADWFMQRPARAALRGR